MVDKFIDINERWENGIPHDSRAVEICKFVSNYDWEHCGDFFCFKSGGDGENGEHLMYLLVECFANKDLKLNNHSKQCFIKNI